ncbi:hypothetical protein PGT21_013013 [Puccinia graminis f. sp. tritici]|uniref:polynucleotide adenylyltransferase n=1 Tax=Puccinia graminis f. sp. tritici TaxID=56615 RepID=A0A5B0LKE8_PUCGR|nr:hypothetical protein PGT21_013013 [Puccinia graminis f. sp. tritici]
MPSNQAQKRTRLPLTPSHHQAITNTNIQQNINQHSISTISQPASSLPTLRKKKSKLIHSLQALKPAGQTQNTKDSSENAQAPLLISLTPHSAANPPTKGKAKKTMDKPLLSTTNDHPSGPLLPIQRQFQLVGNQIFEYVRLLTPDAHLMNERSKLVHFISQVINRSKLGKRPPGSQPYTLQVFGSISFGLDSIDSDLDICILDPDRPQGLDEADCSTPKALPKVYNVKLLSHIFNYAQFIDVRPIPLAKTPILKFRSPNGLFSVDLNCNNLLGCRNSKLIKAYHDLSSPLIFRPLAMVIKQWAKARGYCDPSGSQGPISASSYTLILLLIGYLQVINHLPNLQDPEYIQRAFGHSSPDIIYVKKSPQTRLNKPKKPSNPPNTTTTTASTTYKPPSALVGINASFVNSPPESFHWNQTFSTASLKDRNALCELISKLLLGFFEFYDRFDFESYLISIRDGKPLRREPTVVIARSQSNSGVPQSQEGGRYQTGAKEEDDEDRARDVERLLAGLQEDLSNKKRYPSSDSDEEDEITYIPFACREGLPEAVQRELDSQALRSRTVSRGPGQKINGEDGSSSDSTRVSADRSRSPSHNNNLLKSNALNLDHRPSSTPLTLHPQLPLSVSSDSELRPSSDSASLSSSLPSSLEGHPPHHHAHPNNREPTLLQWPHPIVVVDPFLYERNTAGNIKIQVLDEIKAEFSRARQILASGGSLDHLFHA